jgi:integrase/recombinase XerD
MVNIMTSHYVDCQAWTRQDVRVPGRTAPTVDALVADWLTSLRSANTRAAYASDFRGFADWCAAQGIAPLRVDGSELRRYRAAVERSGMSSATTARRLSAVASFGAFAAERGVAEDFADVDRPTVTSTQTATALGDAGAAAMLRAADGIASRAGALVRLLMLDGLKVGEAVAADARDVSGRPPAMRLDVRGREIRLHPDTAAALHDYVARRRKGPLLLSEGRARRSDRLSRYGVDYLVKQVAQAAGLSGSVSGNTLRRHYVVAAHADGVAIDAIRARAGHADVRTTRRYLASSTDTDTRDR